jgi:hypothetical protein
VTSPPSPAADLDNIASDDEATQLTQFYAGHASTPPRDNRASDQHEHDEADATISTAPSNTAAVSDEDQYLLDYLVLWPHVNPKPLAPDSPASFDWHSTRAGEKVTVRTTQPSGGIGVAHHAAMVLGYYTPSWDPTEPDELRVLLLKQHHPSPAGLHAFPTASATASENVVDAAARGFQDSCGIELSAKARSHLALNHWHLLRESHVDASSWILWSPSLEVICDICDSDFLVDTVWLPLVQAFTRDDGLGPSHGNDWLAWPCDDGTLLSPLYQMFGEPPFDHVFGDQRLPLSGTHVGIEALLPAETPPLRYDTEQFFRLRGALLLAKCAVSTAAVVPPDRPAHADGSLKDDGKGSARVSRTAEFKSDPDSSHTTAEADLADLLGNFSEEQMVALESPNSWLRRGNAEQASGTAKVAHPGGVISSNKVAATAAFLRRKGSGAGAGAEPSPRPDFLQYQSWYDTGCDGHRAWDVTACGDECQGCNQCVDKQIDKYERLTAAASSSTSSGASGASSPPLATIVTSLSQAEFDALVPSIGPQGTPLPPQFVARKAGTIHCDVLGAALFVHGDCWPIKAALKSFGFRFNAALKQWEAPFNADGLRGSVWISRVLF